MSYDQQSIRKLEIKLIEQEHRLLVLVDNYLKYRRGDQEYFSAARKPILWRIFASPQVLVATGGLVAFASLFLLFNQL